MLILIQVRCRPINYGNHQIGGSTILVDQYYGTIELYMLEIRRSLRNIL